MSTPDSVLVVCVNWNGRGVLAEAVGSLLQSDYSGLKVLIVDNASTDDSLSSLPKDVEILRLESNLGYGGAINAAVRNPLAKQGVDYFLLLNNDLLLTPHTLSRLIAFANTEGPGVFGPRVVQLRDPERLEAAWGKVSWNHVLAKYYGKGQAKMAPQWRQPRRVELLLGSALLVHRRVFEKVGLFDEHFFMYHEEVDFLYRARRMGFPVYFCPFAEVIHRGAHSTRNQPLQKIYWVRKNTVYFLRKHGKRSLIKWTRFWSTLLLSLLYNTLMLRWSKTTTIWKAVKEGLAD